jgi:hypothetical protein
VVQTRCIEDLGQMRVEVEVGATSHNATEPWFSRNSKRFLAISYSIFLTVHAIGFREKDAQVFVQSGLEGWD